jgi:hypothetical protein
MEAFSPATWYQRSDGDWVAAIGGSTYVVQGVETPELNDPTGWAFGLLVGDPVAP